MRLRVFLPSKVFLEVDGVSRIVAQGCAGSFGLLPYRRDCVSALAPGLLAYEAQGNEQYAAIDEGVLIKVGQEVTVSTRNAVSGAELGRLREAINLEFRRQDELETSVRIVLSKLESSFIRRYMELKRP